MSAFHYTTTGGAEPTGEHTAAYNGVLHAESVPLPEIARSVGTPVYVYSKAYFQSRYRLLETALSRHGIHALDVCYAVKANSNLAVLRLFHELGAGFDIVSGGELQRVLAAGGNTGGVVFSGVGKTVEEMDLALKVGIRCFNLESEAELERLSARARLLSRPARVAVRVNPDVDAATHPYISTGLKENKFGVSAIRSLALFEAAAADPWLEPVGIACHIGSQISSPEPMLEALTRLLELVDVLAGRGIELSRVDLGGGFAVDYRGDEDFAIDDFGARVARALQGRRLGLSVEPGRFLVANGGVLLTRVEYLKPADEPGGKSFVVVDAAMNDLIRPALYQAWHGVEPVAAPGAGAVSACWDVVGPVCESSDFLARDRELTVAPGDLLAVRSAGAYAMAQSSNYNSRPRPAEVMVDGGDFRVVRRRETVEDLYRHEVLP